MAAYTIFYKSDDTSGQSQAAAYAAMLKYPTATLTDTKGMDEAAIDAAVAAVGAGTQTEIVMTIPLVDAHAEGKFTNTQAIALIPMLLVANQGTNETGTCGANSTVTEIVLEAGVSVVDDFYNNMLIATAGDVDVDRLITDYDGGTITCTLTTTSSAVDASETYILYTTAHLHILGTEIGGKKSALQSWEAFFPNQNKVPIILSMLGESNIYEKNRKTATGVAAGTLTDTGEFVSAAYTAGDYYVAVMTATTGAGQIVKIASNTANVLTLAHNWPITPTGTIVYQIVYRDKMILWNSYLPYAIATYLWNNDAATFAIWQKLLDEYKDLYGYTGSTPVEIYQDLDLLEAYALKGEYIMDSVNQNVLS